VLAVLPVPHLLGLLGEGGARRDRGVQGEVVRRGGRARGVGTIICISW
jgi:hypothetical protein